MFDEKMYNGYKNVYTKMLHGEDTKSQVYSILQEEGLPPAKRASEVAKMVTKQANSVAKRNNKEPSTETIVGAGIYLGGDILDIADKGGFFEVDDDTAGQVMEAVNKSVYQQSIKDHVLDPIKLQEVLNESMPEGMKEKGLAQEGVPDEADETVAMEQYALQRERGAAEKAQATAQRTPRQAVEQRQEALGGANGNR